MLISLTFYRFGRIFRDTYRYGKFSTVSTEFSTEVEIRRAGFASPGSPPGACLPILQAHDPVQGLAGRVLLAQAGAAVKLR